MVSSQTSGELQFIKDSITGPASTVSSPNAILAISTASACALGRRDRSHERLVRMLERAHGDVQMAFGHGDIDRLADHRTGIVQHRRHVGEFVEIVQVFEGAVAALVIEVIDER